MSTRQPPSIGRTENYETIRMLRGLAAILVVIYHCLEAWHDRVNTEGMNTYWQSGQSGVDVFFVISGCVIMLSSRSHIHDSSSWLLFLKRRLVRVLPMYWLFTTLKIATTVAAPGLTLLTKITLGAIVTSFLLMPYQHDNRPILTVGWTLVHEMSFYLVFALAIWAGRGVMRTVLTILLIATIVGFMREPHWQNWPTIFAYTTPVVGEFGFGMVIGHWLLRGYRLRPDASAVLLIIGLGVILTADPENTSWRLLAWGLPAAGLLLGLAMLERQIGPRLPRWSLHLGDASYALYLSHGFLVPVVIVAVGRVFGGGWYAMMAATGIGVALSVIAGSLVHMLVERPLTKALRPRVRKRSPMLATPLPHDAIDVKPALGSARPQTR